MDTPEQKKQADAAGIYNGRAADGRTWSQWYADHIEAVATPLLFGVFQAKTLLLMRHLHDDPEGKDEWRNKSVTKLCRELGC